MSLVLEPELELDREREPELLHALRATLLAPLKVAEDGASVDCDAC